MRYWIIKASESFEDIEMTLTIQCPCIPRNTSNYASMEQILPGDYVFIMRGDEFYRLARATSYCYRTNELSSCPPEKLIEYEAEFMRTVDIQIIRDLSGILAEDVEDMFTERVSVYDTPKQKAEGPSIHNTFGKRNNYYCSELKFYKYKKLQEFIEGP